MTWLVTWELMVEKWVFGYFRNVILIISSHSSLFFNMFFFDSLFFQSSLFFCVILFGFLFSSFLNLCAWNYISLLNIFCFPLFFLFLLFSVLWINVRIFYLRFHKVLKGMFLFYLLFICDDILHFLRSILYSKPVSW